MHAGRRWAGRISGWAAVLALAGASLVWQAPAAQALAVVIPSISGSGTISGSVSCSAVDQPTNAVSSCPSTVGATVTLNATPQATPAGHWVFAGWVGCPTPAGNGCVIFDTGPAGNNYLPRAVFVDVTGPTLTPAATYSTQVDRQVAFTWGTNEPLSAATCSVDGAPPIACSGSFTATPAEGTHTFSVRGTDRSGNQGAPATVSVRIVDTALVSGPADVSNQRTPTFTVGSLAGTGFDCAVDAAGFAPCATKEPDGRARITLPSLAEGTHTFRVRAKDGADSDRVPVVRTWRIDTTAPTATLDPTRGPNEGALQAATTETFAFTSNEPGSTFSCRLDSAPFQACTSPRTVTGLVPGPHRFEVRATDAAGNTSPVVARSWTVAGNPATPRLAVKAKASRASTKIKGLTVEDADAGATVRLSCKGKGCPGPLKGQGVTQTTTAGTLSLAALVKKALKPGARLTVVVTESTDTTTFVVRVRAGKKPKVTTR